MFNFFSSKDKETKRNYTDTPVQPVVNEKRNDTSAKQDIKTAYLNENELDSRNLKDLCDVAEGSAFILGFISPDLNMDSISRRIKQEIP